MSVFAWSSLSHCIALFYTDPGSGALLLQLAAASLVGVLFYFRRLRTRITALFTRSANSTESKQKPTGEAAE